jgi:UDPglucose 6-dehydrogenase
MKICVIGTGYVGLVTGLCLADFGNYVTCVDNNEKKLATLNNLECPFYEPGLTTLLQKNHAANRIHFTSDLGKAVLQADIVFIAVGTPPKENGEADMTNVFGVAEKIAEVLLNNQDRYKVIVNKSTVPVGTGQMLKDLFSQKGISKQTYGIVSNPEFLREGAAIDDFFRPDRIIVGGEDDRALELIKELYRPFYLLETPIIQSNIETAELIKYASNAFLATKISFINEMANICEKVGADVKLVAKGMGSDNRIGKYFLHAGPGYGGSCFPKDTQALIKIAQKAGYDLKIVKAAEEVNTKQKEMVIKKVVGIFGNDLKGLTFGILGLAFKPNTDDMRDAPAITIIQGLLKLGATIKAFDPEAQENSKAIFKDSLIYCQSTHDTVKDVDAMILLTEWNDFRELDFGQIKRIIKQKIFIDARNVYSRKRIEKEGFNYYCLGAL